LPCNGGERFVKIKVVASEKTVAQAVDIEYVRLGIGAGIGRVEFQHIHFQRRQMFFEVFADHVAVSVDGVGGVAVISVRFAQRVDKHERVTTAGGIDAFFKKHVNVFLVVKQGLFPCFGGTRHVAVFRQDDDIHRRVALIEQVQFVVEIGIRKRNVAGIGGLDDTRFHRNHLKCIVSRC